MSVTQARHPADTFSERWQRRQDTRARLDAAVATLLAASEQPARTAALRRAWTDYQAACAALVLPGASASSRGVRVLRALERELEVL